MTLPELYPCILCGLEDPDVSVSLIEWHEPVDGKVWDSAPRCRDRQACRDRVEAIGDVWPVEDRTSSTVRAGVVTAMYGPDPEPAQAEADEVPAWL